MVEVMPNNREYTCEAPACGRKTHIAYKIQGHIFCCWCWDKGRYKQVIEDED